MSVGNGQPSEFQAPIRQVSQNAAPGFLTLPVAALTGKHWPGNMRQLESVTERAVLMSESTQICLEDIKSELRFFQGKDILDFDLPNEGINVEDLKKTF
jgi:DNA-binding NtrC family response regulator